MIESGVARGDSLANPRCDAKAAIEKVSPRRGVQASRQGRHEECGEKLSNFFNMLRQATDL
jgi:hypothetical protein